jgi:hypothetical protein
MKKILFILSLFISAECFSQNTIFAPTVGQRMMTDPITGAITTQAELLHQPVKYATLVPLPANTYSGGVITASNNADTLKVDGFTPALNDRILVKNEATAANNGIYTVTQLATASLPFILTRGSFSNISGNLVAGSRVYVQSGEINAGMEFIQNANGTITIGTTALGYSSVKNYLDKGNALSAGFNVVGTSIEAGYCPSCAGSLQKGWVDYLASAFNISSYNNYAVASTSVRYACYTLGFNTGAGKTTALLSGSQFNMSRGANTNDTLHRYAMQRSAMHRIASIQFTNTVSFYRSGAGSVSSNWTMTGSAPSAVIIDTVKDYSGLASYYMANDPNNTGMNPLLKPSVSAGDSVIVTGISGAKIGIGVMADSLSQFSRIQYFVDGVNLGTYNPDGICNYYNWDPGFTFHRFGIMPDEIIITGLRDTLHTIVLKFLDAGLIGYVDHIASLKTAATSIGVPFYFLDNLYMTPTGYAVTGGNKISSDSASNSVFSNMLNVFADYPVFRFNSNYPTGLYNVATAGIVQSDGIHPTTLGAWYISQGPLNAMNLKSPNATISAPGSSGDILINYNSSVSGNNNFVFDRTVSSGAGGQLRIGNLAAYPFSVSAISTFTTGGNINEFTGIGSSLTYYKDSSQATDHKIWEQGTFGSNYSISRINDANTIRTYHLTIADNGEFTFGGYTSSSAFPITANSVLATDASGHVGTIAIPSGTFSGSIASTQVAFGTGTNAIGGSANLVWDNTNNRLGIGKTPASIIDAKSATATIDGFDYQNTNANAQAALQAENDAGSVFGTRISGSTDAAYYPVNTAALLSTAANMMLIQFGTGDIIFATTTSSTDRGRVTNSGNFLIGSKTDNGSRLQDSGSVSFAYIAKVADYTAGANDFTIDVTTGADTITLPTAVGIKGRIYIVTNSSAGTVSVRTTSSQTFTNVSGTPTIIVMATLGSTKVQSTGANWIVLNINGWLLILILPTVFMKRKQKTPQIGKIYFSY